MQFSAASKLECALREVKMRERVYPNRVMTGRMSSKQADYELEIMRAIADDYRTLSEKERLL